ncbi:MAG TPA: DUF881 domain-containing protein [Bacillales bacterium]|nr:DUF881 domain-containing protein [Bacillales bacterium]
MFHRRKIMISTIACLVGFMLVLQFKVTNQPEKKRDTRDAWQLRDDLSKQKSRTKRLYEEQSQLDVLLANYKGHSKVQKVKAMKNELKRLKKEAGLTKLSGQGIVVHVEPLVGGSLVGQNYHPVNAELLRRLINELNEFGAGPIEIAGQRLTANTPIRDVNGEVYVNDHQIPDVPFTIKALAVNAKKLHDQMVVSDSRRDFAEAGLNLTSKVVNKLTLPAYDQQILVQYMKPARGNS